MRICSAYNDVIINFDIKKLFEYWQEIKRKLMV